MKNLFLELGFENSESQMKYGKESTYISRLFSRYISDLKIKNLRKIYIGAVDSPERSYIIPANNLTKVCLIYKYFNLPNYEGESIEANRYKILLNFILESILEVSEKFDWPKEVFKEAYSKTVDPDFINEFVLLPPKLSSNKRFSASIIAEASMDNITLYIELINKEKSEMSKVELIKVVYFKDDFSDIAYKLKWINNKEIIISNKEEEINFKFTIQNGTCELFLIPRVHDEKYLLDELKLLDPKTSKEEYLEINKKRTANLSSIKTNPC